MFQFSFFSLLIGFAFLAYINLFFWLENSGVFPSGSEYFDVTDLAPYAFFIPLSSGISRHEPELPLIYFHIQEVHKYE